jgi:4-amino-4-deoxy-L-arabinose transferase-like glycosyltransferase
MAQVLAQTGHVVYNGWETPMLGWQLFLGAAMARLFGFSFTAVRLSTLIVAMATAYLVQRTFVRAGIRPWNATLATMTFVLSPMFVPLAFGFMTDISGVFCTVLCLYMCLRAVQAGTENSMTAWISVAAMLNGLGFWLWFPPRSGCCDAGGEYS